MGKRKRISLYIASQLVDLDDESFILLNYTMEDLSNPTIIHNSFSKQIVLKGSPINNKIFGDLFRMDRTTLYGQKFLGAYFDPARKTPFTIYNEMNEVVESGYMKVDKVVKDGVSIEYHITLYGGLGSFFYGLMYNEDGTKRTLSGMSYLFGDGTRHTSLDYQRGFNYQRVNDAWEYLANQYSYDWEASDFKAWNVINFAPAYNGIPENFSADKAVVIGDTFSNVPEAATIDGKVYSFKSQTTSNLMVFTHPHDAWRMRDLRWYLMRPVVRMKSIIEAICNPINNGGYEVLLDQDIFGSQHELFEESWLTLPMISPEDKDRTDLFDRLLNSTKSPGEYLISFAKIFGAVFLCDRETKKITITSRQNFYKEQSASVIDLTKRINTSSISIKPILGDQHFYQMGNNVKGEWAAQYKEDYGFEYGIQKINTGNQFNNETKVITSDIVFSEAADVQERDLLFAFYFTDETKEDFSLPKHEVVKLQLWNSNNMEEIDVRAGAIGDIYHINPSFPYSDWLPKVQLHDKDQKPIDGTDVLVVFNGIKAAPKRENGLGVTYTLSDDTQDMMKLNDNKPTWNFTETNVIHRDTLPSFNRYISEKNGGLDYLYATWEWGSPKERGTYDVYEGTSPTIYNKWWKNYLTDRYDDNTIVLTCKANLGGLRVGQELLGRFFYYDGAIFVLNKITNHSLTTWDDTECEFIKVQDINNYIG